MAAIFFAVVFYFCQQKINSMESNPVNPNIVHELSELETLQYLQQMKQQLTIFWNKQLKEMEKLEVGSEQDFKNHNDLPLARIKRIMKSDEDVRMISAEAPVLFAKACEMFILELTLRYYIWYKEL